MLTSFCLVKVSKCPPLMAFFALLLVDNCLTKATNILHFKVVESYYILNKKLE